jgi:hypothetical protein
VNAFAKKYKCKGQLTMVDRPHSLARRGTCRFRIVDLRAAETIAAEFVLCR